jgi:hypothetical protein
VEGWGIHLLASMEPIERASVADIAARLPESAKRDLLEWTSSKDVAEYLLRVLSQEFAVDKFLNPNTEIRISDDKPFNEYFLIRRSFFKQPAP